MTPLDQFLKEAREKREAATQPHGHFIASHGADYFTFACNNQERFEKLVRVAVKVLTAMAESKDDGGAEGWYGTNARAALDEMNEIAGEK